MADTQDRGPWRTVSEQMVQYLVQTRHISEWLSEFSIPEKNEQDPDFSQLEKMVEQRNAALELLKEVDRESLEAASATDDEKMCRELSTKLMAEITELEQSNDRTMEKFASQYREKMKSVRQARETVSAYSQAQAYSVAATGALGHHFNQAN